jgi:hypothetical protein
MITLTIPEASPSLNEHKWQHWSRQSKIRKHWSMLVLVARNQQKIFNPTPIDQALVTITREGYKLLEYDNLVGGAKGLVDSLRDHHLIVDDDEKHVTVIYQQRKIPRSAYPRTLIEIKRSGAAAQVLV